MGGRRDGREEGGFVLVVTLMIMLLLVLIGISATTSTDLELQIAGADRTHTETFYNAEAGLEASSALLEENISCSEGFSGTSGRLIGPIRVNSLTFWLNDPPTDQEVLDFLDDPAAEADIIIGSAYPWVFPAPDRATSILTGGEVTYTPGAALQMAAGYVGLGKAAAGGGAVILYDLYSQHLGMQNSETILNVQWRHVVGQEGPCRDAEL
jgi:hypothetical protein